MARRVKPATATQRSRASRLRRKRRNGETLNKTDHKWLVRYDADRRLYKKQGRRLKAIPKRERDRAYRLRRKKREGKKLTAAESRKLSRYEKRVASRKQGRAQKGKRPKPITTARRAARAIGAWSSDSYEIDERQQTKTLGRAYVEWESIKLVEDVEALPTHGNNAFPTETNQLINISIKIKLEDGDDAWYTVIGVSPNWENIPNQFAVSVREILKNYNGVGIIGAEVTVWNYR